MTFLDRLHVEPNGVPIYLQIRDQILAGIGAGVLKPGERMPTMREVAVALRVDLNTVKHAYDAAKETGAIVLVKARGTYVAEHPPKIDPESREQKIEHLAYQTIAAANTSGLDPVALADRIIEIAQGKLK
jgi:GntR family transcriptional regulator